MPELIDKAKVLKYLTPRIKARSPYGEGYNKALEDAAGLVTLMHTIEPEVRHGRWIDKGEYAVCTECGGQSGTQYDGVEPIPLMTQFCPHCGARMDGGDGNDT